MDKKEKENLTSVKIAKMTPDVVDKVCLLGMQTAQFDTGTEAPQMYSKEALLRAVDDPDHVMLVAMDGDSLVGFTITGVDKALKDAELHTCMVLKEYENRGIGSQLLEETLRVLEERPNDVNHVVGFVEKGNTRMQNFLEKRGFSRGREFIPMDIMLLRKK